MSWSLAQIASHRTSSSGLRPWSSRLSSWKPSSLSSLLRKETSLNVCFGSQGRTICSGCFRKFDLSKRLCRQERKASAPIVLLSSDDVTRCFYGNRSVYSSSSAFNERNRTTAIYVVALAITVMGFSYLAVPLYRLFCQATGLGGTVKREDAGEKIEQMERKPERELLIRFNADKSGAMRWNFKPQQTAVKIVPGETALAFYTATNPTDQAITGISTYNVIPFEAGQYFNKIQCFCFEEQRLNPREQVDMPVFFYIDPEFTEDPAMAKVDTITLSYTFFEAKEAEKLGI